ncbi:MAG: DUF3592 domain-containing protein [Verrucomicrobia bacterium]|nr:DUF3592 domain-containing protein [Verrucomicrobiota bacterium]
MSTESYTPGYLPQKWAYFAFGILVFMFSAWLIWEPLGRLLFGEKAEARVREIIRVEPGEPDQSFLYRRTFEEETNLRVTFQHYVTIPIDGTSVRFRLGVDSRRRPYVNVNDRVTVVYYANDPGRIAYVPGHARTWGMATLYFMVGLCFVATAIPMLLTARKPIIIDPEAPNPDHPTHSIDTK